MGKKSVEKLFVRTFLSMIAVLTVLAVLLGGYAVSNAEQGITETMRKEIDRSIRQLEKDFGSISSFNREITANDTDFSILSLAHCTDAQRVVSEYNMRRIVVSRTASYAATFLIDDANQRTLYGFGEDMDYLTPLDKQDAMRTMAGMVSEMDLSELGFWQLLKYGDHIWACYVSAVRSLYLCTVVDMNVYLEYLWPELELPNGEIVFYQSEDILVNNAALENSGLSIQALEQAQTDQGDRVRSLFVYTESIPLLEGRVSLIIPISAIFSPLIPQIIFIGVLILLFHAVALVYYRFLKRVLCFPLQQIAEASQNLEESSGGADILAGNTYVEFNQIGQALNNLLQQKEELMIAKQKKEMAQEHAMLQYYQLQTRSHFFLNCLKSLYGMSEIGETGRMQMMISAFAAHLRYVFLDTLSLIRLKEELKEVSDYHKIISADFPRPFLLYNDVPAELLECKIPGLLLQTLLENTYKHNGKRAGTLLFQIVASRVEAEGKHYLRIHVSDNGVGYTPQAIQELNAEPTGDFDQYNVGINNLKRRMKIIYQGDYHIAFHNGTKSGAVTVIYLPYCTE